MVVAREGIVPDASLFSGVPTIPSLLIHLNGGGVDHHINIDRGGPERQGVPLRLSHT